MRPCIIDHKIEARLLTSWNTGNSTHCHKESWVLTTISSPCFKGIFYTPLQEEIRRSWTPEPSCKLLQPGWWDLQCSPEAGKLYLSDQLHAPESARIAHTSPKYLQGFDPNAGAQRLYQSRVDNQRWYIWIFEWLWNLIPVFRINETVIRQWIDGGFWQHLLSWVIPDTRTPYM